MTTIEDAASPEEFIAALRAQAQNTKAKIMEYLRLANHAYNQRQYDRWRYWMMQVERLRSAGI